MGNIIYLSNPANPQAINTPDSLAYQAIMLKTSYSNSFNEQYGDGSTLAQMDFGTAYAMNCAKYCVIKLAATQHPEKELEEYITEFSSSILHLHDVEFNHGISSLYLELQKRLPNFFLSNKFLYMLKATISQRIILALIEPIYEQKTKHKVIFNTFNDYKMF